MTQKATRVVVLGFKIKTLGRGGGQVVRVLAFYSDDLSLNPAEAYIFSVKFVFEKNESKQKRPGMDHLKHICYH